MKEGRDYVHLLLNWLWSQ